MGAILENLKVLAKIFFGFIFLNIFLGVLFYPFYLRGLKDAVYDKEFNDEVHRLAAKYNQDENLAKKIIKCESKLNASAVGSKASYGKDIGYFQINSFFHEKRAEELGLDIYDWKDNLEYGFRLLKEQGTSPWKASRGCWNIMDFAIK